MSRLFDVSVSDKIENNTTGIVDTEPFTFACWAYPTTDIGTVRTLISVGNPAGAGFFRIGLTTTGPSAFIQKQADGGTNEFQNATGTVSINNWYHVAGIFTSGASRTVYRDGVNNVTGVVSIGTTTTDGTSIGVQAGNIGTPRHMNGRIAEVGIWNVALTADEIVALAKGFSPKRIRTRSLIFYVPLIRNVYDAKGLPLTTTGTVVADHPRVFY